MSARGCRQSTVTGFSEAALGDVDVMYVTRIQKARGAPSAVGELEMLMGHLPRVRFAGAVRDAGVIRAGAGRFRRYQGNNDHGARRCVKALNGACGVFLTWAPRAHAVQAEDVRDAPAPAHGGTLDGGGRGPARRVLPADAARHARAHGAVVPRA